MRAVVLLDSAGVDNTHGMPNPANTLYNACMQILDSSFWADWRHRQPAIDLDRALTELRRGRPVLVSLSPGDEGDEQASTVCMVLAIETLAPGVWTSLRSGGAGSQDWCVLLSAQRMLQIGRDQDWSNLLDRPGALTTRGWEQPFSLPLPESADSPERELSVLRRYAGLDLQEMSREEAVHLRYGARSLAGNPRTEHWGQAGRSALPAQGRNLDDPCAPGGVALPIAQAALALARLARLVPAVACLTLGEADAAAVRAQGLTAMSSRPILEYAQHPPVLLEQLSEAEVPLASDGGRTPAIDSRFVVFREIDNGFEHVAVVVGHPDVGGAAPVRVRLHSSCLTGDLFGSLRCDCGDQLRGTVQRLAREGGGIILYLSQEGRGIGLVNKLRAYRWQGHGLDTLDANHALGFRMDERNFAVAAAMLKALGCHRIQLLTNNPTKIAALREAGIDVAEREAVKGAVNGHNQAYLLAKMNRGGHLFDLRELRLEEPAVDPAAPGQQSVRAEGQADASAVAHQTHPEASGGGRPLSQVIRERLQSAGRRFHANDNIADFIHDEQEHAQLQDEVAGHMQSLLEAMVIDTVSDHNTRDTARRVARMYLNEVFGGRYRRPPAMTEFPNVEKLNELLLVGPIKVRSACSHHFCPIMGKLWIGVLPNADSNLIGLSKYARLAEWIMTRPQIQEEAVKTLADELERRLLPDGLAVVMKADHFCMHWRGVKDESQMTSSVMRGAFLRDASLRREFLGLI